MSIVQLPVARPGDVNRHRYRDRRTLAAQLRSVEPDVLDLHEEPFSVASAQVLDAAPPTLPVVMYTAQNIDKRFPPPFCWYERRAYRRIRALYPCSRQAASVSRGKGFGGMIMVLPLGFDPAVFRPGEQSLDDQELRIGLFGRFVPEKGTADAVMILARLNRARATRLTLVGDGPERESVRSLAARLGIGEQLEIKPWLDPVDLAEEYRRTHVMLVPSRATASWTEQFGRVIVEAHAAGAVVAGYRSGAIPEVANGAGVLVREREAEDLAVRIERLVRDPVEFHRLRQAGFRLAEGRTWKRVGELHAALYERALAAPGVSSMPSGSRRRRRARAEFGATAPTPSGDRPFALPVLRKAPASRVLGWSIDSGTRMIEQLRG
jgi:glycosyltransferase involved in cell wall biosynthesis